MSGTLWTTELSLVAKTMEEKTRKRFFLVFLSLCFVYSAKGCEDGRYGANCEFECHCYKGVACDVVDGKCPGKGKRICEKGWLGDSCNKPCPDYKYGSECNKTCGKCWGNKPCNNENGNCPKEGNYTCEAGYFKARCIKECDHGKWAEDCRKDCGKCLNSSRCHSKTGDCPGGLCAPGWHGARCDIKSCPEGKYGALCEKDCGNCYGNGQCNKTTGDCPDSIPRCQPGWMGQLCKMSCFSGYYGSDCTKECGHCLKNKTCDLKTGLCPNQAGNERCQPGWKGTDCSQECTPGEYGIDCNKRCSQHCFSTNPCDSVTGACKPVSNEPLCHYGYHGKTCHKECEFGTYGKMCLQQCGQCHMGSCNVVNGSCYQPDREPRCQQGWRGPGCDQPCVNGTFGADCAKRCHCKGDKACSKEGICPAMETGESPCRAGWTGSQCDTECSPNLYGEGCHQRCGHCRDQTPCDFQTGACPLRADESKCLDGWTGDLCNTEENSLTVTVLAVTGGIAVLVMLVAGFIIITIRRRRSQKNTRRLANGHDSQQLFNLLSPEERNGSAAKPVKRQKKDIVHSQLTDEHTNASPAFTSRTIAVDQLLKFIASQRAINGFQKEHESLPKGLTGKTKEAEKPENKPKNRFQGIVAYDHSRVVLKMKEDVPGSDYINACFVRGYNEQHRYIASQGPTPNILDDFWRMIWQYDCTKIIMLTNLIEDARIKCDKYWPSEEPKEYGDISVTLLETESFADFSIRTMSVTNTKEPETPTRIVKQFHFTVWPDHGVPTYPTALVHFRERVHATDTTDTGPLVIHCSAGIGRTGTFIGLDYLIDQAMAEDRVDVLQCVLNMRKQRVNMIQNEEQYAFLYEALAEAVLLSNMSIPSSVFDESCTKLHQVNPKTNKTGLQEQFEMLESMSPKVSESDCTGACLPENKHRNRDNNILPVDNWRPFLVTQVPDTTDYINAVFLPAYRDNHAFIVTQMPLPHTTVDMWRLIHAQKSQCVLMLNDLEALEEENCVYWPYDDTTEGMFGPFKVQVTDVEKKDTYDIQTMSLVYTNTPEKDPLIVKQFVVKFWKETEDVPSNPADLIGLMDDVERWKQQCNNAPVIVHCMNGADKSGLYCAVTSILERLKIEHEVNILQTVKQMRINRPQLVKNLAQYKFCFDAVSCFLESFQTYSNFK